nr:MAG TPA: hypothetical protein [Caudoviricetes sp.]
MTKRRDRNRAARRRKPKRYIIRWTDETLEDLLAEPAARILQTTTKGEPPCWNTTNAKSSTISP